MLPCCCSAWELDGLLGDFWLEELGEELCGELLLELGGWLPLGAPLDWLMVDCCLQATKLAHSIILAESVSFFMGSTV